MLYYWLKIIQQDNIIDYFKFSPDASTGPEFRHPARAVQEAAVADDTAVQSGAAFRAETVAAAAALAAVASAASAASKSAGPC